MNREFFEDLFARCVFIEYSKLDRKLIRDIMLVPLPVENKSTRDIFAFEGAAPKAVSMEVLVIVPTTPRSPRPKPTPTRDVPK